MKILHGHVNLQLKNKFVQKAISVLNATSKPRVYIAGAVYEQRLVGRIVDRRKAEFVGRFPLLPEPVIIANARRLLQMSKQRGVNGMLSRLMGRKSKT